MALLNRELLETKIVMFFKRWWDLYIKKNIRQKHIALFYIFSQESSKGSNFLSYSDSFFDFKNGDDKIWWVHKKKASERKFLFQRQVL